jgi:hypothetical protein
MNRVVAAELTGINFETGVSMNRKFGADLQGITIVTGYL